MRKDRSFAAFVHVDDVIQRRSTRSAASASASEPQDAFEAYLTKMSRLGTYGGEPELIAFCQAFDQDVTVHLPKNSGFETDSIFYTNQLRDKLPAARCLHIAYGGEEKGASGHYDSARSRDGSHPPGSQYSTPQTPEIHTTPAPHPDSEAASAPTARAIRSGRSELSQELIHDLVQKSRKEVDGSFDAINRARSNSVTSSHRSTSSKRSLEDEGDNPRRKRADRRKSKGKRTEMSTVSYEGDDDDDQEVADSPSNTPASTQDTETSSGNGDPDQSDTDDDYHPGQVSDSDTARIRKRKIIKPTSRASTLKKPSTLPGHPIKIAERPRSILRI